jgi:hypothetical protein
MVVYLKAGIKAIDRLTLKQLKAGTFGGRFKAKDYPGALNLKRGMPKKGKPKLKIV